MIKHITLLPVILSINVPEINHDENDPFSDKPIIAFSFMQEEYLTNTISSIHTCKINYISPSPNPDPNLFKCVPTTKNHAQLFATKPLDREAVPSYTLKFDGYDINGRKIASSKTDLKVKVRDRNDNAPVFLESSLHGQASETATIGSTILTVKATDLDDPESECPVRVKENDGRSNPSTCIRFLTSTDDCIMKTTEDQDLPCDTQYFSIDEFGNIIVTADLDAEKISEVSFLVTATDGTKQYPVHRTQKRVVILIKDENDHKPEFESNRYIFRVPENIPKTEALGFVKAVDDDRSPEHHRIIYEVMPEFEDQFTFKGNALHLRNDYELDFEDSVKFPGHRKEVQIKARNENSLSIFDQAQIVIEIIDVNEAPVQVNEKVVMTLMENNVKSGPRNVEGKIIVEDKDFLFNQTVRFDILTGDDPEGWFELVGESRELRFRGNKAFQIGVRLRPELEAVGSDGIDRECKYF